MSSGRSASGYSVFPIKLAGFVLYAAVTGLAGGLMTLFLRGVYPNPLSWEHAPEPVLMLVLGGVHHFLGSLWGAASFIVLQDQLSALMAKWWLIFAPILMVVALTSPGGPAWPAPASCAAVRGWTLVRPSIPPRPASIERFRPPTGTAAESGEPLLQVRGLTKSFGKLVVASGYDFDVHAGMLHSFIGPNGAGKTTFFNMLTGLIPSNAGTVTFLGKDITQLADARACPSRSCPVVPDRQRLHQSHRLRERPPRRPGAAPGGLRSLARRLR